jgi:hypothetical protein
MSEPRRLRTLSDIVLHETSKRIQDAHEALLGSAGEIREAVSGLEAAADRLNASLLRLEAALRQRGFVHGTSLPLLVVQGQRPWGTTWTLQDGYFAWGERKGEWCLLHVTDRCIQPITNSPLPCRIAASLMTEELLYWLLRAEDQAELRACTSPKTRDDHE